MRTVREITFDLFRKLGLTTVVGNPGSTEESLLADFPADFDYVLALQEPSVVAVLVNLHTEREPATPWPKRIVERPRGRPVTPRTSAPPPPTSR